MPESERSLGLTRLQVTCFITFPLLLSEVFPYAKCLGSLSLFYCHLHVLLTLSLVTISQLGVLAQLPYAASSIQVLVA